MLPATARWLEIESDADSQMETFRCERLLGLSPAFLATRAEGLFNVREGDGSTNLLIPSARFSVKRVGHAGITSAEAAEYVSVNRFCARFPLESVSAESIRFGDPWARANCDTFLEGSIRTGIYESYRSIGCKNSDDRIRYVVIAPQRYPFGRVLTVTQRTNYVYDDPNDALELGAIQAKLRAGPNLTLRQPKVRSQDLSGIHNLIVKCDRFVLSGDTSALSRSMHPAQGILAQIQKDLIRFVGNQADKWSVWESSIISATWNRSGVLMVPIGGEEFGHIPYWPCVEVVVCTCTQSRNSGDEMQFCSRLYAVHRAKEWKLLIWDVLFRV